MDLLSLSGFGPFLSAMFTVNFAFGVWQGVILSFVERFRDRIKQGLPGYDDQDKETGEGAIVAFLEEYRALEEENVAVIERMIRIGQNISLIIAAGIAYLLAQIGYSTGFEFPRIWVAPAIFVFLSPVWTGLCTLPVMYGWRSEVVSSWEAKQAKAGDILGGSRRFDGKCELNGCRIGTAMDVAACVKHLKERGEVPGEAVYRIIATELTYAEAVILEGDLVEKCGVECAMLEGEPRASGALWKVYRIDW